MGVLSISVRQGADPAIVITDNYTYTSNEGRYSWKYNGQAAYGYFEIFIESAESSESNAATILEFQTKIMY
jgi:hypothetical protein